jgi:hypothetical protein
LVVTTKAKHRKIEIWSADIKLVGLITAKITASAYVVMKTTIKPKNITFDCSFRFADRSSTLLPTDSIHCFAKKIGEYHNHPNRNTTIEAMNTEKIFTSSNMVMLLIILLNTSTKSIANY